MNPSWGINEIQAICFATGRLISLRSILVGVTYQKFSTIWPIKSPLNGNITAGWMYHLPTLQLPPQKIKGIRNLPLSILVCAYWLKIYPARTYYKHFRISTTYKRHYFATTIFQYSYSGYPRHWWVQIELLNSSLCQTKCQLDGIYFVCPPLLGQLLGQRRDINFYCDNCILNRYNFDFMKCNIFKWWNIIAVNRSYCFAFFN